MASPECCRLILKDTGIEVSTHCANYLVSIAYKGSAGPRGQVLWPSGEACLLRESSPITHSAPARFGVCIWFCAPLEGWSQTTTRHDKFGSAFQTWHTDANIATLWKDGYIQYFQAYPEAYELRLMHAVNQTLLVAVRTKCLSSTSVWRRICDHITEPLPSPHRFVPQL